MFLLKHSLMTMVIKDTAIIKSGLFSSVTSLGLDAMDILTLSRSKSIELIHLKACIKASSSNK